MKSLKIEIKKFYVALFERDFGLQSQILTYPPDQRDEVRRAYITFGSFQSVRSNYPNLVLQLIAAAFNLHGCALRGYDKSRYSGNRGNFLKLLKFLACHNEKVDAIVFDNAPPNATRDEPKNEQMAIVLRFVDRDGFNICVHGYYGASNMRSEWKGLQALISNRCASCKRQDELQKAQAIELTHMLVVDERDTVQGLNQMDTLQRPGDTQKVLKISDLLYQVLPCQSQDMLDVMHLVLSTKSLIQELRDNGWNILLIEVKCFCELRNIDTLDLSAHHIARKRRARHQQALNPLELQLQHYSRIHEYSDFQKLSTISKEASKYSSKIP
ncbi:uncharacterized protein LOC122721507 [Manihot esculenta]|uniref:uncharacterized protein LOC122721507 n=1 Tax=Manihot esculenta TaxID=3983 RepID=UPI001CC3B7F5|nr:uncharacterized protein LOC122721507 [Manihot esculenta]